MNHNFQKDHSKRIKFEQIWRWNITKITCCTCESHTEKKWRRHTHARTSKHTGTSLRLPLPHSSDISNVSKFNSPWSDYSTWIILISSQTLWMNVPSIDHTRILSLTHTHTRAREPLTFILYRRFNAHQADSMEPMPLNEHSDTEKTSKPNRVIRCDVMRCSEENGEIGSEQTSTRQLCMMSCCYLFIYL